MDSPKCLNNTLELRSQKGLFFAGQITGVEGYVESTAAGLLAGINAARLFQGLELIHAPKSTGLGGLIDYVSDPERKNFQPMNISFGLIESYVSKRDKNRKRRSRRERREAIANNALRELYFFAKENAFPCLDNSHFREFKVDEITK
jgi:methylenetetrahydrofolate--tRNA-(uracil-5-)-methyltransferase